jgi:hypothetical protein
VSKALNKVKSFFTETLISAITNNYLYKKLIQPIVNVIKVFFQTIAALHTYESGFLSILVFVMSSIFGNFVGV